MAKRQTKATTPKKTVNRTPRPTEALPAKLPDGQELATVTFHIGAKDKATIEAEFEKYEAKDWQGFMAVMLTKRGNIYNYDQLQKENEQLKTTTNTTSTNPAPPTDLALKAPPINFKYSGHHHQFAGEEKKTNWVLIITILFIICLLLAGVIYLVWKPNKDKTIANQKVSRPVAVTNSTSGGTAVASASIAAVAPVSPVVSAKPKIKLKQNW